MEIMEMMDKRLNDKGKNWRHVFKVSEHICLPWLFFADAFASRL